MAQRKIRDMVAAAPPVDPAEAKRRNLYCVLLDSVSTLDVQEVAGTLLAKAKQGDIKAINLLLSMLQGNNTPAGQQQAVVVQQASPSLPTIMPHSPRLLVATPSAEEVLQAQRIEVADVIRRDGPKSAGYLGASIHVDATRIREVLACDWFEWRTGPDHDIWSLTQKGWTATKEED